MKKLAECKETYKDLHMNCLANNAFEKSEYESVYKSRFEMFRNALEFIYGEEYKRIEATWTQESLKEFYSNK